MATSGTVASTTIDTAAVLEHAFRRCKVLPSAQTPETVLIAKQCLYMLLLNLGNRGLNLWCVERQFIGLSEGQAAYSTAAGTLDVLNVIYSQPTIAPSSFTSQPNGGIAQCTPAAAAVRLGAQFNAAYTGLVTLSASNDGVTYTTLSVLDTASYAPDAYYWFDVPAVSMYEYYALATSLTSAPLSDIKVSIGQYDLPMTQWNRDTYTSINAKTQQGRPSTSYFFEKKLTPRVTVWPVPNNSLDHLMLYVHRQPQDVGSLTQQLDIPQRWLDGFIWLLAARLCFELPMVEAATAQMVVSMSDKQIFEAEQSETDGAPIYLTPNIGGYSR